MSKETMKMALEALENVEHISGSTDWFDDCVAAALALKEALAKQEQRSDSEQLGEPVAYRCRVNGHWSYKSHDVAGLVCEPLYTAPYVPEGRQQRPSKGEACRSDIKPLTIEEIAKLDCYDHFKFARAIEAAHGVKE